MDAVASGRPGRRPRPGPLRGIDARPGWSYNGAMEPEPPPEDQVPRRGQLRLAGVGPVRGGKLLGWLAAAVLAAVLTVLLLIGR